MQKKVLKKELAIIEEPRKPGQFIDDEEKVREYLRKNNISKEELEKDFDEIVNQKVLKDWCTIYDSKYSPSNYGDVKIETQWENWWQYEENPRPSSLIRDNHIILFLLFS